MKVGSHAWSRFAWIVAATTLAVAGCSVDDSDEPDDDEVVSGIGTVAIDQEPGDLAGAGWILAGPVERSGSGDQTFASMPNGQYALSWTDVAGYASPASSAQTLIPGGTITFAGTYTQITSEFGTIVITQEPADLAGAGWELSGPRTQSGSGSVTLADMPAGRYTLTWDFVPRYLAPTTPSQSLVASGTITFAGTYTEQSGEFVRIAAGTFSMGSPTSEPGRSPTETQHEVTLTRDFYMATHEVTEAWWGAVVGGGSASQRPITGVSFDAALAFCNALSALENLTPAYTINGENGDVSWNRDANGYRLPTEAEWEYACRAGSADAFMNGPITNVNCAPLDASLDQSGWYCGNAENREEVGQKQANAWGLYDMHGNLWEWVWDNHRIDYAALSPTDPVHETGAGDYRVLRGGSWNYPAHSCRSAARYRDLPTQDWFDYGLRPVRTAFD